MPIDPINGYYYDPNDPDELGERISLETKYYDPEKKEFGYAIQAKDIIMLDAPKVLLSPDTPLLTNAQDVAGAINELFNEGGGGGDEDKWKWPETWPELPEPGPYEIYILIGIRQFPSYAGYLELFMGTLYSDDYDKSDRWNMFMGIGPLNIDWGDGTIESYSGIDFDSWYNSKGTEIVGETWPKPRHQYLEPGFYIVRVSLNEHSNYISDIRSVSSYTALLAIKCGTDIIVTAPYKHGDVIMTKWDTSDDVFCRHNSLKYIKYNGNNGYPKNGFVACPSLEKIDTIVSMSYDVQAELGSKGNPFLNGSIGLQKYDFSKTKVLANSILNTGLKEINLDNCEEIRFSDGITIIGNCNSLQKVSIPLISEIPRYFLQNCYALYELYAPLVIKINQYGLQGLSSLKELNLPECEYIDNYACVGCQSLRRVYAPKCKYIGAYAFSNCLNLSELIVSDECEIDPNAVSLNNYSLWPLPN